MKIVYGIITALLACMDLWSKDWAEKNIRKGEKKLILKDKIELRRVYNEGFALNMAENHPKVVKIVSVIVCGLLSIFSVLEWTKGHCPWRKLAFSLSLAGAISNTYDRLVKDHVIDYFGFRTKHEKFNRITFNLGDMFLFIGSAIIVLSIVFGKVDK